VALDNVDFSMESDSCVAIIGASGSGKTTLARALCGLTQLDSGGAFINRVGLDDFNERRLRTLVQYIPQKASLTLNPWISIGQTFAEVRRALKDDVGYKDNDLLSRVGLSGVSMRRSTRSLSEGQQQRLVIARALLFRPALLICDEITASQDPIRRAGLVASIRGALYDQSTGILFVSHDLQAAYAVAGEWVVMDGGRIVERFNTDDIFRRQHAEQTQRLLSSGGLGAPDQ